ncbi:c-type cytochrome [Paracoccus marinus]|uniref:c-type cytochrome n=1 Tax=Paracoccus marinus TaxID=288426 RepID=UPI00103B9C0A|nr:cytochrome c [Paracoccus marinus]GLS81758.1 cytochrome c' [Paracoccus marinus]
MRPIHAAVIALMLAPAVPLAVAAQDGASPAEQAVEVRHGYMTALSLNMAPLAAMAKGDVPYEEATATMHARNLAALGAYGIEMHFLPGSAKGEVEGSNMLPEAVQNLDDVAAKHKALADATAAAPAGVVGGQEQVAAVLKSIGGTCKACHDQYRGK